ncbi:MAG: hypothetical protein AAF316_10400, partial [Cyanobacteria bacterium P01_A01_bin.80]
EICTLRESSAYMGETTPLASTERHFSQRGEPAHESGLGTSATQWLPKTAISATSYFREALQKKAVGNRQSAVVKSINYKCAFLS